jgi:hypothetical protein
MYEPEVDDYVIWKRPNGDWEEGWVYFKGDPPVKKKGFLESPRYITIEVHVKDKPTCMYSSGQPMRHKKIHVLLLCNDCHWHELEYVKHRRTREIQHYSQYDDIAGNEEGVKSSSNRGMYKSQEGRLQDY